MSNYVINYNEQMDRYEVIECCTEECLMFFEYKVDADEYVYNLNLNDY